MNLDPFVVDGISYDQVNDDGAGYRLDGQGLFSLKRLEDSGPQYVCSYSTEMPSSERGYWGL